MRKIKKNALTTIILAAGEGTRMKSGTPKVLHRVGGKTLLQWVLDASAKAGATKTIVVLGHQAERVAETLPNHVVIVRQMRQLGTGHAVQTAWKEAGCNQGDVLLLCGDAPLIRPETLKKLVGYHRRRQAKATLLTACLNDPHGYGRIVRDRKNRVLKIVEEKEATLDEKAIREVNSGAYCFSTKSLEAMLGRLKNNNQKGEYYLTDIIGFLCQDGEPVEAVCIPDALEISGINTRHDLIQAAAIMNRRKVMALLERGVTVWDPARTWIDPEAMVGQDTQIYPGTVIKGKCVIGPGNTLGPDTYLETTRTGKDVAIRYSVVEHAQLGDRVTVGPYSHLRSKTIVESDVHIGNFAETNRSRLKKGVKVGHVSYLGDAVVGEKTNIGAGTITANYNGVSKQATVIGEQAFIGSGSVLVAPCRVGRRALTGAGTVVKPGTVIPPNMVAVGVPARVIKQRK